MIPSVNGHPGPDFIGLGAQKCGTSWLAACLDEHPDIFMPRKEIHFFSRERNWERGREWYEGQFAAHAGRLTGEFCTSYLEDPFSPERVAGLYPEARLICCLRSPLDRAVANYRNDVMSGVVRPDTPFADALATHPEYLSRGRYAAHLSAWLTRFQRGDILVLILEDARDDAQGFVSGLFAFIGADPSFRPPSLRRRVNESRVPAWVGLDRIMNGCTGTMRSAGLGDLVRLMRRARINDLIYSINTRTVDLSGLLPDAELRRELWQEHFAADTGALEIILGRSLAVWRP